MFPTPISCGARISGLDPIRRLLRLPCYRLGATLRPSANSIVHLVEHRPTVGRITGWHNCTNHEATPSRRVRPKPIWLGPGSATGELLQFSKL